MTWLVVIIAVLTVVNLVRMTIFMVGSDLHDIKRFFHAKKYSQRRPYRPLISVIIPAHNEEAGVVRGLMSVMENNYKNKEVFVVDDGSTDKTYSCLRNYKTKSGYKNLHIIRQKNAGKAAAINNAARKHAKGSLIMVLDADSLLASDALENMVKYFRDRKIMAASANVKIIPGNSFICTLQQIEYAMSYRLKRGIQFWNVEYIIGGVGSTFRHSLLKKVGYYDTDSITEDIKLSMKLVDKLGNRKYKFAYASDVAAYTEHVLTYKSLIRQRYRWKYGRFQTFIAHKNLFWSRDKKHNKQLSWVQLPMALFGDLVLFAEPLLIGAYIVSAVIYQEFVGLAIVYTIITTYVVLNLWGENNDSFRHRVRMIRPAFIYYFLSFALTFVELVALVQSMKKFRTLISQKDDDSRWEHVERSGEAVAIPDVKVA